MPELDTALWPNGDATSHIALKPTPLAQDASAIVSPVDVPALPEPDPLETLLSTAFPDPPPPPPPESREPNQQVDVDLGPLKSVSRNHAVIQYSTDLLGWTLRIVGRNGAWINERYFAKGHEVPLDHGWVVHAL